MSISKYINKHINNINGKKVIVTGANSGIGFEICKHLAYLNASIIMACRSFLRASKARNKILKIYPNADIKIIPFDQSNKESCDSFIDLIKKGLDFDVIIFNAGIFAPKEKKLNKDNYPITLATNIINLSYIVDKLEPLVNKDVTFVFQGSLASSLAKKKLSLLDNKPSSFKQYALSKYALLQYFKYKSITNPNKNIRYTLCEPGITNSNIIRDFPKFIRKIGNGFLKICMMSTSKASLTSLASFASKNSNNGMMFVPRGLFKIWGYPKAKKINNKYDKNIILELNKIYHGK